MVGFIENHDDDDAKKKMLELQEKFSMEQFSESDGGFDPKATTADVDKIHDAGIAADVPAHDIDGNDAANHTADTATTDVHLDRSASTIEAGMVVTDITANNANDGTAHDASDDVSLHSNFPSIATPAPAQDRLAVEFERYKADIARKEAAGTLKVVEEVAFFRAEMAENTRQQRIVAEREYVRTPTPGAQLEEDDNDLFVGPPLKLSDQISDVEDAPLPKKRGRKRKADGDTSAPTAKKAPRKKKPKSTANDDATSENENATVKGSKKVASKRKPKVDKTDEFMNNLSNLMGSNVFDDVRANENLPAQPVHNQKLKVKALQQLVASMPDKVAGATEVRRLRKATQDFVVHSITPAPDGLWSVKGLRTTLKHFQVIGSGFIIQREKGSQGPKGGILADQMGLGKTLMILTTIVNNALDRSSKKPRATLVVASHALVNQWCDEIDKHVQTRKENERWGIGTVLRYHAGSRIKANNLIDLLEQADIVLTTYHEVSKSYPKVVFPPNLSTLESKNVYWEQNYEAKKGLLHRCKFYRVVLDEAHAIKNHRSHTSLACRALEAKFRWAVTGTPVQNNIAEFYPYFKFLRDPHASTHQTWKENFAAAGSESIGSRRLSVLLSRIMMRRTHIDTLFNARLLDLPTPKENTVWLDFNNVERKIYEIVKERFVNRINAISSSGQFDKQYSHIWTMLLRLRQICGHVLLVQESLMDLLEREDYEKLSELTKSEDEPSGENGQILIHLRRILAQNVNAKRVDVASSDTGFITTETETVPVDLASSDLDFSVDELGGTHGLTYPFKKYLDAMRKDAGRFRSIIARSLCCGCDKVPQDPFVISCSHIYCWDCLEQLGHLAARRGQDCARCTKCGEQYTECRPCLPAASTPSSYIEPADTPVPGTKKRSKKRDPTDDWIDMGDVLPSAKTLAAKSQILNWLAEDPSAKIIVFSQFRRLLKIMSRICQTEGWGYCLYTGDMTQDARTETIAEFRDKPNKKILLCAFKAGGIGLNLTMASRTINLDPWWNVSSEQQAFCRVFRIGQDKIAHMTRLVIRHSIDAAMMAMQARKSEEIDFLIESSKKRYTIEEIMSLFGTVGTDESGHPFIYPDSTEPGDEHKMPDVDYEEEQERNGMTG